MFGQNYSAQATDLHFQWEPIGLKDVKFLRPTFHGFCWQSENMWVAPALSFVSCEKRLSCSCWRTAHPRLLWLLLGRRVLLPEELIGASLISPSLHAESLSTPRSSPQDDLGWVSDWAMSCFAPSSTHTHAHTTLDHHLTVAMTTFNTPFIPKHVADFLKIMCVVFSGRLLSRQQPSEQILVLFKVGLEV